MLLGREHMYETASRKRDKWWLYHLASKVWKAVWSKGQNSNVPGPQNQSHLLRRVTIHLTCSPCVLGNKTPNIQCVYTRYQSAARSPELQQETSASAHAYPASKAPVGLPNWSNRGLVNHKPSDKNQGCNDSSCKSFSYVLDKCHQQLHWQMWPPHGAWIPNSQSKFQLDGNSSLRGPVKTRGPKITWSVSVKFKAVFKIQ